MARSLANKSNVEAPDYDFPFGRIRDRAGSTPGTPVNEDVYGDMHQFFEKLMDDAGLTHNEDPESEADGFQFNEALDVIARDVEYEATNLSRTEAGNTNAVYRRANFNILKRGKIAEVAFEIVFDIQDRTLETTERINPFPNVLFDPNKPIVGIFSVFQDGAGTSVLSSRMCRNNTGTYPTGDDLLRGNSDVYIGGIGEIIVRLKPSLVGSDNLRVQVTGKFTAECLV